MLKHVITAAAVAVWCSACGSNSSPVPAPTPTPPATQFNLTGHVSNSASGGPVGGVTVKVVDGSNANKSTTTNSGGDYALLALNTQAFSVSATATYYNSQQKAISLTSNQSLDFQLQPIPVFSQTGSGDNVFTIPSTVTKIKIDAQYNGFTSNFIVKIAGRLVVNELIGTGWNTTTFSGTYVTTGGQVEITNSSGVNWQFTEQR